MIVGEVAGVEDLDASIVLTIECRYSSGATGGLGSLRRTEPQSEVVHLDWIERRVQTGIRKRTVEHHRRRRAALREGERLDAEPADELLMPPPVLIGLNVALVP